jgi:hypothetical protein
VTPDNIDKLRSNIGDAIKDMKRNGTTGASFDCLKQNTSTRGLTCPVSQFHSEFNEHAAEVAKVMKFKIYKGNKQ